MRFFPAKPSLPFKIFLNKVFHVVRLDNWVETKPMYRKSNKIHINHKTFNLKTIPKKSNKWICFYSKSKYITKVMGIIINLKQLLNNTLFSKCEYYCSISKYLLSTLYNFVSFVISVNQDIKPFNSENCVVQRIHLILTHARRKITQLFFK